MEEQGNIGYFDMIDMINRIYPPQAEASAVIVFLECDFQEFPLLIAHFIIFN